MDPKAILFRWGELATCGQKKTDHPNRRKVIELVIQRDLQECGDCISAYVYDNPQYQNIWEWACRPELYFYYRVFLYPLEDREMLVALWDYLGR
jgi:hypothetical protein